MWTIIVAESIKQIEQRAVIDKRTTLRTSDRNFRFPERKNLLWSTPRVPCCLGNFDATQPCRARRIIDQCSNDPRALFELRARDGATAERAANIPT